MQSKTTMRHHLTPIRRTVIKKTKITKAVEDAKKEELSYANDGDVN